MDLTCLYLGNAGWVPLYSPQLHRECLNKSFKAYMPFRATEKYTTVSAVAISNLFVNENKNLDRRPQMIPRVMVKI